MIRKKESSILKWIFSATVIWTFVFAGCSGAQTKKEESPPPPPSSGQATLEVQEEKPLYLYFSDILIPRELNEIKKDSFVFRTPGMSAGVLALKGSVEINSLIAFFENNMAKDNWTLISAFKSPRSMMLFQKENRWCVINITDQRFSTYVEIWVAPMIVGAVSGPMEQGLLK
ncbi:hypothetical protein D3OALGB2SA_909 [Olavius algarvensis associated proteobacterium Delta 3]|nr:hypothetical protein D3OALGB2SA_909 [Olavius algarvensis associated proteobacterium Delta 3]